MRICSDCVKKRTLERYYRTRVLTPLKPRPSRAKVIEVEPLPEIKERPCAVFKGYLFAGEF